MQTQGPDRTDGGIAAARALCEQGARLHDQAEYDAARARYEQALAMLEGAAAVGRATTRQAQIARCLGGLGRVLVKLGDDAGAEERLERALAIQDRVLGAGHPDRAATLHDLAELRADRGDLAAGVALLRKAVSIRLEALGAGYPDTLESTAVLALLLAHSRYSSSEGDRARAEKMLTDALARCERNLGERHRATARVLNALTHILGAETPSIAVDVLEGAVAHPACVYLDAGLERSEPAEGEALVVEEARAALSHIE